MLFVELVRLLRLGEPTHLQLRNGETVLVNSIDNFAGLSVTVWLDHSEGSSRSGLKFIFGEDISIVYES